MRLGKALIKKNCGHVRKVLPVQQKSETETLLIFDMHAYQ